MVILAAFQQQPLVAFGAAITLIIGAAYTLWMVKRVIFGEVANHHVAELNDINAARGLGARRLRRSACWRSASSRSR